MLIIIGISIGINLGFQCLTKKKYSFRTTKLFKTNTCFPEEEDDKKKKYNKIKKNINNYTNILLENINIDFQYELLDEQNKPLYTLIWFNCEECNEIRQQMKQLNHKHIFINLDKLFLKEDFDIFPLLYKEDICVGDNLFDIYKELYL